MNAHTPPRFASAALMPMVALTCAFLAGHQAPASVELIDLSWKDSAVERVTVRSLLGRPLHLRRGDTVRTVETTSRGAVLVFEGDALRRLSR